MSIKFNPNSAPFVPSKLATPNNATLSQQKTQKLNQNTSAHSAPPSSLNTKSKAPSSFNTGGSNGNSSKRNKGKPPRPTRFLEDELENALGDEFVVADNHNTRGKRGQISINHLLDFSLPPREIPNESYHKHHTKRRTGGKFRQKNEDTIHLHNEEFINANYRFVVDYRNDYKGQILDPNLILNHEQILRILIPKGHHCPICLTEEIVAPRMISCGHVFCNTCLLSFLDSETLSKSKTSPINKFKECPLCSKFVKPNEIKPVLINNSIDEKFEIPHVGQDCVFKLMAKPIDNILSIPHSLKLNRKALGSIPWYSDSEIYPYARLMQGGLKFIVDTYENDKAEILKQFEEDKLLYNEDGKYVFKAIEEIDLSLDIYKQSFNRVYSEPNPLVPSLENLSINGSELNDSNCFFFYQTAFNSTTKYVLSPLDVKILLETYGSYSNFPETQLLKVDNIHYGQMLTEANIKKHKYLSHLPFGTELAFIDINWSNMLSPEIYQKFSKVLVDRRRKILSKIKKEDFSKKIYDSRKEKETLEFYKQENDGWGIYDFEGAKASLESIGDDELEYDHRDETETSKDPGDYTTTVWGTKILKSNQSNGVTKDDYEDEDDTEDIIRRAELEKAGGKKKGRKKLVVLSLSSNSGRI